METKQWIIAAGFVAALLGCGCGGGLFGLPLLISGASRDRAADRSVATPRKPAPSPTGRYLLVVLDGTDGIAAFRQWEVLTNDAAPKTVYCAPDRFRNRDSTRFAWGEGDRVWVYSGDVGTYYWEQMSEDHWGKHTFVPGAPGMPPLPPSIQVVMPGRQQR